MDAFLYDGVRTPRGLGKARGALAGVPPIDLLATCFRALRERVPTSPALVSDVLLGCVTQTGEQGGNLAKIAALYGDFGESCSGVTLNRFCASGLAALGDAATRVASGSEALVVAGGVESMSRVPMLSDGAAWFQNPAVARATGFVHMGIAADAVATLAGLSREDLDAYALDSHERALHARREAWSARRLVPVLDAEGRALLTQDEGPREGLTLEKLAAFAPIFAGQEAELFDAVVLARRPELGAVRHLHTVATSPSLADGAALVLVGTEAVARPLGLSPIARIVAVSNVATDPVTMLVGNVAAAELVLTKAGLTVSDIARFEINESFAAVPLHFAQRLGVPRHRLNVCGGAIALGHPLGATGIVLALTLIDELGRSGGRFGIVSICAGAGIASAVLIERL